jgi:hypothetical protein
VEKPAQLQHSGFSCGKACCNSLVPVQTLTRNRSSGLEPLLPVTTTYWRCDFAGSNTKNCWRSVDAHFHDGAGRVLLSVLPIKAAKNSIMTDYNILEV